MTNYLPISTLSDSVVADATCEMLESAGIPVMLEHVEIIHGNLRSPGYRVLVPEQFATRADLLVTMASSAYSRSGMPKKPGRRLSGEWMSRHGLAG